MIDRMTQRLEEAQRNIKRATLVPFLVRLGIGLSLLLAMTAAWPAAVVGLPPFLLLAVIALLPAFRPGGKLVTFAILIILTGWVIDTVWQDSRIALWRVLTIATLTYLAHTLAALAAQLPTDAVVSLDVVLNWLGRAGAAVLLSAVLTIIALGLADDLAGPAFVVATLAGLAAAVGATILLARLLRRPGN